MGIKSEHYELLNMLDKMQQVPYLATYANILRTAENLIVEQENRIKNLEALCVKKKADGT